jgi:hypothetical protein
VDVSKVAPRRAVEQLAGVLDSPEVARLTNTLEYVRWTGRPGYPVRAMVGMCLVVKSLYALPTWTRAVRLVAEHDGLLRVIGCAPSQWACYRFARMLRERDNWALSQCVEDVRGSLRNKHPEMGRDVAIDASDLPAYANGHRREDERAEPNYSDPDPSWGHRSAVSTRAAGRFYGYKIDAAVDVGHRPPHRVDGPDRQRRRIDLRARADRPRPQARLSDPRSDHGQGVRRRPDPPVGCMEWGIAPIIALKETGAVKRGAAEPAALRARRVDVRWGRLQAQGNQVALPHR